MNPPMDAPIDMVVNPLWQWIFGVLHFGVAGLTIYLALRNPMRHRDWWEVLFRTVILCSGALGAVVFEGAVDRAGKLWYAEHGAWPLVQFWGTHVPLWVAPVYLWFIGGGSHNSLAVEHKDFVTVIEGPLDDARSNAVIAETHKLIPGKPIRYLINTHHHWDHSGGIRAFVAEGATVGTDEKNKEFYRDEVLVPQPRSLSPDRLSQFPFAPTGPGTLSLQTFTDRATVGDATRVIELYHVEGLPHSSDMLVAYLPASKILVNADLYSPPPAGGNLAVVNPNAVALFNNVKRLKLDVAQHVPIHGNPGGQADFDRIVGPVAAKAPRPGDGG